MEPPAAAPFTLQDFRLAAERGAKLPMLTCYDFTTARLLAKAGVQLLLVGDSAANVLLGHATTLPVTLDFMIEIAAAVKRGAPDALVVADLPFGCSVNTAGGARAGVRMLKESHVDAVKIECGRGHTGLVQRLADSGVAVFAHVGLTPQSVGLMGGYKAQGRTAQSAYAIADLAGDLVNAGAAGLLLEAVPPEVSELVTQQVDVPVIGCGAGPACHAHVVVLHDLLGLSERQPKFAPAYADVGKPIVDAVQRFARDIASGRYPSKQHSYLMPADESKALRARGEAMGLRHQRHEVNAAPRASSEVAGGLARRERIKRRRAVWRTTPRPARLARTRRASPPATRRRGRSPSAATSRGIDGDICVRTTPRRED